MTKIRFTFKDVQGNPIVGMPFRVMLRRATFDDDELGVAMPEQIDFITDENGQRTVELRPLNAPYRVSVPEEFEDRCCGLSWAFYVPETDEIVDAQTLFMVPPPSSQPWDDAAMGKITQAVSDSKENADKAAASALEAFETAQSIEGDATDAREAAVVAKAAAESATGAATTALESAVSAKADAESAELAKGTAQSASNAAGVSSSQAADSASQASTSALSAQQDRIIAEQSAVSASSSLASVQASEQVVVTKAAEVVSNAEQVASNTITSTQEADRAKTEADRAQAATDGKVDKISSPDKGSLFAANPIDGWKDIGPANVSGALLPLLTTENATFRDEGTSVAGWAATDMSMTVRESILRATKTNAAGAGAQITKPVTLPANGKDYILYVKMRSNTGCVCWLNNASGDRLAILWLNAINSGLPSSGSLSITGYKADGTTQNLAFAEGVDTTKWVEMALHYDSKFGTLTVYQRKQDGGLEYKGRVACDHNSLNNIAFRTLSSAPLNSWIEFDYVQVSAPNIVVVGDSIAEGKPGFSPNMSLGLNNYLTTWMNYAKLFTGLRNNLIVGKGVGGNSSAAIKDRSSDYAGIGAKLVFLHASSNDTVANISQTARTANIQASVDAVKNSGAFLVLLNAMYGTSGNSMQPALRDYMNQWWTVGRLGLTGVDAAIDIMEPLRSPDNFMKGDLTDPDGIHWLPAGARAVGNWVYGSCESVLLLASERAKLQTVEIGAQVNPDPISQPEAESGTNTTSKIWSAVRVRQAIAAWAAANLGTAATKNVTANYLDQTPGLVAMLDPNGRGFHGLGNSQTVPVLDDFKGLNRTCFGLFTTGTLNGPPVGSNGGFMNIYANAADTGYQVMFAGSYGSPDRWAFGKKTGNANPVWAEAWHEKNQLAIGTSALSARTALEINQGVVIQSGVSDFNAAPYTITGQYTLPQALDNTFLNAPAGALGLSRATLKTYATGGYTTQELTLGSGRQFTRASGGGSWGTWSMVFNTNNIVGTVSQSAGVPQGAVIERGSNSNGEYIRFADGTQYCWFQTAEQTLAASGFITVGWSYPAAFQSPPWTSIQATQNISQTANNMLTVADYSAVHTNLATRFRINNLTAVATPVVSRLLAIGRWY